MIPDPDRQRELLPGFRRAGAQEWAHAAWQDENAIDDLRGLREVLGARATPEFLADLEAGLRATGMKFRSSPHWLGLFSEDLRTCPLRRQTLPLGSELSSPLSHPWSSPDRLREGDASSVSWFIQRYPSTALVLVGTICPVCCVHCTRMADTGPPAPRRRTQPRATWTPLDADLLGELLAARPGVWDVLLSGGDAFAVAPSLLDALLGKLLSIDQVRNVRLATRALVTSPWSILQGERRAVLERRAREARSRGVSLAVHTQVNHSLELSLPAVAASAALLDLGISAIRNQAVLLRGVNDEISTLSDLFVNLWRCARIEPYCVYLCEMVSGVEHLRTTVGAALALEDALIGRIPGFSTPRFLVDLPILGKRPIQARTSTWPRIGVSAWTLPASQQGVAGPHVAFHADPLDTLDPDGRRRWSCPDGIEADLREHGGQARNGRQP
jgi:lysine 2,3-aminomutase